MQIQSTGKNVRLIVQPDKHTVHYTTTDGWDVACVWQDPTPGSVVKGQVITLGMSATVQRPGPGFGGATIMSRNTGLAVWHILHEGNAAAGRTGDGRLRNGSDTSKYDPCSEMDAKPTVVLDVLLADGGATSVRLARYTYQRQAVGTGGAGGQPPPSNGFAVGGQIGAVWQALGGARGSLGNPASAEMDATPSPYGTQGRYNLFEGGVIIWHKTGRFAGHAFVVQGAIAQLYQSMGGTASWLGFPVSDEYDFAGGRRTDFEGGRIVWTRAGGAKALRPR